MLKTVNSKLLLSLLIVNNYGLKPFTKGLHNKTTASTMYIMFQAALINKSALSPVKLVFLSYQTALITLCLKRKNKAVWLGMFSCDGVLLRLVIPNQLAVAHLRLTFLSQMLHTVYGAWSILSSL